MLATTSSSLLDWTGLVFCFLFSLVDGAEGTQEMSWIYCAILPAYTVTTAIKAMNKCCDN
jgi:hypothetical protein